MTMTDLKGTALDCAETTSRHKEWDEISCPICMEHPHNAILLICSSHEKGCRSYICDTSYRHSNCLDRFKKMREDSSEVRPSSDRTIEGSGQRTSDTLESFIRGPMMRRNLVETLEDYNLDENSEEIAVSLLEALEENNNDQLPGTNEEERSSDGPMAERTPSNQTCLKCPLCRGSVMGWMIVKEARHYWDLKLRSCSRESCSFSGNYLELRRHARRVHPTTRPGNVDPLRQRSWRRLEHQQEYGDILSAIRSAMPGAVVLGDYVLDTTSDLSHDHASSSSGEASGSFWSTFLLFHMISSPIRPLDELRQSPRGRRRRRGSPGGRHLWGENLLGLSHDDDDVDDGGDDDEDNDGENIAILIPRRRRRITRSTRINDGRL